MRSCHFRLLYLFMIFSLLAGCGAPSTPIRPLAGAETAAPSILPPVSTQVAASPAVAQNGQTTPPSGAPAASPTPDLRLPPERWQEWPVVPQATGKAIDTYRQGQVLGNDPRSFSKVGDCQSIKEVLMGLFDRPGYYVLTLEHQVLKAAIDQFAGSFNRDGMAVQGGFNAASVLSPLWANPETCKAGETPLECEFRVHKPSFVIISLEVWWNGRTPERYDQYMRRIIEFSLAKGVVPILSTKADNVEGNQSINLATAKLAYEYDLPLWNWWRAAQDLPNGGLDPTRPDGFHISKDAWNLRAFTALAALDSVWKGVRAEAPAAAAVTASSAAAQATLSPVLTLAQTASPQPSNNQGLSEATAAPTPTYSAPTPGPTPIGGSGKIFFGLAQRKNETLEYLGVYAVDLRSTQKTQIAGSGYNLQDLSPDGTRLLVNQGSDLFLMNADGTQPVKISSTFFQGAQQGALWLPTGGVAFIASGDVGPFVVYYPLDGAGWRRLTAAGEKPVELYPSTQSDRVYWGSGSCSAGGECTVAGASVTTLAGETSTLAKVIRPALSAQIPYLAYSQSKTEDQSILVLGKTDGSFTREAPLPGNNLLDYGWSPDGKRMAVLMLNRSDYSGKWGSINAYLFVPEDFGTQVLPKASGLNARAVWAPDGQSLLLSGTDAVEQGYALNFKVVNLRSMAVQDLTVPLGLSAPDLLLTTHIAWLPVK